MSTADVVPVELDLTPARFGRDIPFEAFARLRQEEPVHWHEPERCWVVTSHEHVRAINLDTARFSNAGAPTPEGDSGFSMGTGDGPERTSSMLLMDPPLHTRYRHLVNRSWVPRAIEPFSESIRAIVREALGSFLARGGGDFAEEVAAPIPFRVTAEIIGMPLEDEDRVLGFTNRLVPGDDPELRPDAATVARAAVEEAEYADQLIEDHRRRGGHGLIGQLLDARIDGRPLGDAELREFVILYINGGTETTRHLINHGLLALMNDPEQASLVERDAVEIDALIEEMLRWSTPVMHHSRTCTEAVEIAGKTIEPGQRTTLWMISANRDGRVFEEPEKFDARRRRNPHTSLGSGGPHYCLGAYLARLEGRIVFEELRGRCGSFRLAGEPERLRSSMFNAIKHLPVEVAH